MKNLFSRFAVLCLFLCVVSCGKEPQRMVVCVEPLYNSNPLTIQVGEHSEALTSEDPDEMLETAAKIHSEIDRTTIETLYVLAIRLYDLGLKDEAAYWFYTAQIRKNIYIPMLTMNGNIGDPQHDTRAALEAFSYAAGSAFSAYAGEHPDRWAAVIQQVLDEASRMGHLKGAYPSYPLRDETAQQAVVEGVSRKMADFRDYMLNNQENN